MKYFSIEEMTGSVTARARGIDNTPTHDALMALTALIDKVLDPVREAWGRPIRVNSGYRSPILNAAVGGAKTSQHLRGEAADITAGSRSENADLFTLIKELRANGIIEFDQLIDEKNYSWIHVSYKRTSVNRNQILKL